MAIRQPLAMTRPQIGWLNSSPPADGVAALTGRGYDVKLFSDGELEDPITQSLLSAVIFTQSSEKPRRIEQELGRHAARLLDYDCTLIVRPNENFTPIVKGALDKLKLPMFGYNNLRGGSPIDLLPAEIPPPPYIAIASAHSSWNDVANEVVRCRPGAPPNRSVRIIEDSLLNLSDTDRILLQRAFHDCSEIHLTTLGDGRSGATVLCVHATLANPTIHGPSNNWPLPYFVKIDRRFRVASEYKNYQDYVEQFVPFHLGPDLVSYRCGLGATHGIIVGNFIEESESFLECARDGRGLSALACLFSRTLRGWYRGAQIIDQQPVAWPLRLPHFPSTRCQARVDLAHQLGATKSPTELVKIVADGDVRQNLLIGPTHGDLHARNIRVRSTDAIVIDFLRGNIGPLLWDIGCLEASLVADCFGNDARDATAWLRSIEPLYSGALLREGPVTCHPRDGSAWFYDCVRKLRLYAREMEQGHGQYAFFLGLALLHKASKDLERLSTGDEGRRAGAYVLAERLLSNQSFPEPAGQQA
jgi:hypothetical protein